MVVEALGQYIMHGSFSVLSIPLSDKVAWIKFFFHSHLPRAVYLAITAVLHNIPVQIYRPGSSRDVKFLRFGRSFW